MKLLTLVVVVGALIAGWYLWRLRAAPPSDEGPATDGVRNDVARALETRKKD